MIIHVEAIPRVAMEGLKDRVLLSDNVAAISIIDPDKNFIFERNTHKIYQTKFSDIEPSPFLKWDALIERVDKYVDTKQANEIVAFIRSLVIDEKEWKLFINCSAGISRSGAIATFTQPFSTMKDSHFAGVNRHIHPNWWVVHKLIEAWRENYKDLKRTEFDFSF